MAANPSSRWYWNDWENDLGLKLCSLAAQGLWMRMLSLAARSEPLGYVSLNGRSFSMSELADAIGRPETEVRPLVEELDRNHVFSRDRKGRIFCRRMVRDEKARLLAVENGKKGGHPEIRRGTVPKEQRERRFRRSDSPKKTGRIFARDGGKCHWCGIDLSDPTHPVNWHIDHVIAIADGGNNDEENLVAACDKCNGSRALLSNPYGRNKPDRNPHPSPPIPLPLPLEEESIAPKGAHSEPAVRSPTPRRLAEQMVEVWREVVCPVLPNVTKLTEKRIASACRRLTDEFNGSLDDWRRFLQRVRGSPMLTGENDRGWRADFDFCTRLDAVLHIIEGRYDDKRNGSGELSERRAPDRPAPAVPEEFWSQYPDVRPPKH